MNSIEQIITILIGVFGIIVVFLVGALAIIKLKEKSNTLKEKSNTNSNKKQVANKKEIKSEGKQAIFNFFEFDKIEDNMIIQDNGKRFLMAIKCQGINYDLMSELEKVSVEEGFVQFLNTLRYKVQIYIQTRKVNLENSIENYEKSIVKLQEDLKKEELNYKQMISSGRYTKEQLNKELFEITKIRNLYEYGKDVIENTKKMSLNKNILTKEYFIIIPYYIAELGDNDYNYEEIKNIAFSELYTRAQSTIRVLSACEIKGNILNTNDLIDLLYVAYNRDEAETYGIDKYLSSQADSSYLTSEDLLDKKMRILDQEIQRKALEEAQMKVLEVQSEKEKKLKEKEKNKNDYIDELAMYIIKENEQALGKDIVVEATKKIKNKKNIKKS